MLRIYFIISILHISLLLPHSCLGQKPTLEEAKSRTLKALRDFRNSINSKNSDEFNADTLTDDISELINNLKTIQRISEVNNIYNYIHSCNRIYSHHPNKQTLTYIKNDLELKLKYAKRSLEFENEYVFSRLYNVTVKALVNGKNITNNTFRLYWTSFRGGEQSDYVSLKSFEGASNLLINPYSIKLDLPGYKIFWLINVQTREILKSDILFNRMTEDDLNLTLNFRK